MKLRVNLYQSTLQPVKVPAGLLLLLRVLLGLTMLLALLWSLLQWQLQQQQQQLALQQQEQQSSLQQLEILQQTLVQRQPSVELTRQAQQIQQSIQQKQQLLAYLRQQNNGQAPAYAAVMAHLAAIDPTGLWLTRFSLGSSLQFQGVVRDSQQLPLWLQALGQQPQLQGLTLATVRLNPLRTGALTTSQQSDSTAASSPPEWLEFEVSTAAEPAAVVDAMRSVAAPLPPMTSTPPVLPTTGGL
jgi:Tfp pilus assembly protein PilN